MEFTIHVLTREAAQLAPVCGADGRGAKSVAWIAATQHVAAGKVNSKPLEVRSVFALVVDGGGWDCERDRGPDWRPDLETITREALLDRWGHATPLRLRYVPACGVPRQLRDWASPHAFGRPTIMDVIAEVKSLDAAPCQPGPLARLYTAEAKSGQAIPPKLDAAQLAAEAARLKADREARAEARRQEKAQFHAKLDAWSERRKADEAAKRQVEAAVAEADVEAKRRAGRAERLARFDRLGDALDKRLRPWAQE